MIDTDSAHEIAGEPRALTLCVLAGFRLSRAVWLAARLRLADLIATGPAQVPGIALAAGAHPSSLARLLNALAFAGLFRRERDGRFAPTAGSEFLRSDHPRSQRAWLELALGGEHFKAWGAMETAVRTGCTAFAVSHGATWVDYYRTRPEEGRAFGDAMAATMRAFEDAILDADPFPAFQLAVDVGGSRGSLCGDCSRRSCGECAKPCAPAAESRSFETVLPETLIEHPGWLMDLNMLAITGGRERTGPEFDALLERTGRRHEGMVATASPLSVVLATAP